MSADLLDQTLLYSLEAEKAVLGCMLAQPVEVMDDVTDILTAKDFRIPEHQEIFDALHGMSMNKVPIEAMALHQWLVDAKLDKSVGSPGIISELLGGFATHMNMGHYIRIVKDKSLLRALQASCSEIVQEISERPGEVSSLIDFAEGKIMGLTAGIDVSAAVPISVLANEGADRILGANGLREKGITTGFEKLDMATLGWHRGEMIVLAARPSVGKSALAGEFGIVAARAGHSVGIISIEMTNEEWMDRYYASDTQIPLSRIREGVTLPRDQDKIRESQQRFGQLPVFLDSPSHLTITGLRAKARRMKKKYGIDLLIVDYLQLMTAPGTSKSDNRQTEVAAISRGVKGLARELNIPIIILAQLNRKSEDAREKDQEPQLHHLKESGAIEQDADMVLLLHRPKVDNEDAPPPIIPYKLKIGKQRNGPRETIGILFKSSCVRFEQALGPTQPYGKS